MYQLKGFVEIESYVSNLPNEVSSIGELSSYCQTFAKDKGIFNDPTDRNTSIISFCSKSTNIGYVIPPHDIVTMGLRITNWIYYRQNILTVADTKDSFISAYVAAFLTTCDNLNCGELIAARNGKLYPEWITWKNKDYAVEDNINKLWLSDNSFRHQYDEYEIIVIPPIDRLDYFFNDADLVKKELKDRTYSMALNSIGVARGNYPETTLSAESFDWVNPFNPGDLVSTDWSLIIYGPKGNDYDLIVNAIYDYILQHTNRDFNEWRLIFPDIFKRTEFVILPRWKNYAIPNLTLQAGIYSPVINLAKELNYIKRVLPGYAPAHIDNHATVLPNTYKNLVLDIIGNFDNKNNLFEITQIYPDILNISTSSNDFTRMSAKTQAFLITLASMIMVAEQMTDISDIPLGLRRTIRDGVVYATASIDKMQFLMACKGTIPDYI